jgi:hypothetical protein
MKSIEDPWTQELERDTRKNMKIPRKKEKPKKLVIIPRITRDLNSLRSNQAKEMEVMIKNNVKNTYEWNHCKIQRFLQKEGEDYDNNLFQIYLL